MARALNALLTRLSFFVTLAHVAVSAASDTPIASSGDHKQPAVAVSDDYAVRHATLDARSHQLYEYKRFDEALAAAQQAAALTEHALGDLDPQLAVDLRWIVQLHMDREEYEAAEHVMKRILTIRQTSDGERPWLIKDAEAYLRYIKRIRELSAAEYTRLAQSAPLFAKAKRLTDLNRLEEAIAAAGEGIQQRFKALGYVDKVIFDELTAQSLRYGELNQLDDATHALNDAEAGVRALLGDTHRIMATLLQGKALVARRRGDLPEALKNVRHANEMYLTILGPKHDTTLQSLSMVRDVQMEVARGRFSNNEYEDAAKLLDELAADCRRILGERSWQERDAITEAKFVRRFAALSGAESDELSAAADSFSEASALADKEAYQDAANRMFPALKTIVRLVGPTATFPAKVRRDAVTLLYNQRRFVDAEAAAESLIADLSKDLGLDHPTTLAVVEKLLHQLDERAGIERQRDEFREAAALRSKIVALRASYLPNEIWRLVDARLDVAHLERLAVLSEADRADVDRSFELMQEVSRLTDEQKFNEAMPLAESALALRRRHLGENNRHVAMALHSIGFLHEQRGEFLDAVKAYEQSLDIRKRVLGDNHPDCGDSLINLGAVYVKVSNVARAEEAFRQATEVMGRTAGKDSVEYGRALNAQATIAIGRHDAVQAEPLLQEAIRVLRKAEGRDREHLARALHNLAPVYEGMVMPELAESLYREALPIWRESKVNVEYAICLDNLAEFHRRRGELADAEHLQLEAVSTFRRLLGPRHMETIIGLGNLSELYRQLGKDTEALATAREAAEASRQNLQAALEMESERARIAAFDQLRTPLDVYVSLAVGQQQTPESIYPLVVSWKAAPMLRQRWVHDQTSLVGNQQLQAELIRAVQRLSSVALRRRPLEKEQEWIDDVRNASLERERLEQALTKRLSARQRPLDVDAVILRVSQHLPADVAVVDYWEYVGWKRQSDNGQVDWRPNRRLMAFILRSGSAPQYVDLGDANAVDAAISEWQRSNGLDASQAQVESENADEPAQGVANDSTATERRVVSASSAGETLRELVWARVESLMDGIRTVVIIPDGALCRVPLAALPDKDGSGRLIDHFTFLQTPSLATLPLRLFDRTELAALPKSPDMLLVGNVDYGTSQTSVADAEGIGVPLYFWERLGATSDEVQGIARLYSQVFHTQVDSLTGLAAAESALLAAAPKKQFIHLATHGRFLDPEFRARLWLTDEHLANMMRGDGATPNVEVLPDGAVAVQGLTTMLALAGANGGAPAFDRGANGFDDGLLTAGEVVELDLRAVELVVLSACQTGLGELVRAEGVQGLPRAFHVAGARNVVASLWSVNDPATAVMMQRFYHHLWVDRQPTWEALRNAQLYVRSHPLDEHDLASLRDPSRFRETPLPKSAPPADQAAPIKLWAAFIPSVAEF